MAEIKHDALAVSSETAPTCTTVEAARVLGLAVRSVQLMVDRGELEAWKTPGGHRRISRASVADWLARHRGRTAPAFVASPPVAATRVLLIEDSVHYQNLVRLLLGQRFPELELHVAADGVTGLTMVGRLNPQILLVDILLPGVDGATLITSLRSNPHFRDCQLIVITSLDEPQLAAYAYALAGVPVVHKTELVTRLPDQLGRCLQALSQPAALPR